MSFALYMVVVACMLVFGVFGTFHESSPELHPVLCPFVVVYNSYFNALIVIHKNSSTFIIKHCECFSFLVLCSMFFWSCIQIFDSVLRYGSLLPFHKRFYTPVQPYTHTHTEKNKYLMKVGFHYRVFNFERVIPSHCEYLSFIFFFPWDTIGGRKSRCLVELIADMRIPWCGYFSFLCSILYRTILIRFFMYACHRCCFSDKKEAGRLKIFVLSEKNERPKQLHASSLYSIGPVRSGSRDCSKH